MNISTRRTGSAAKKSSDGTPIRPALTHVFASHYVYDDKGEAAWPAIALQALYQGALVGVGALFLYTKSVELLGAARATLFLPLNPVVTAFAGVAVLGEYPSGIEVTGMLLVIAGMSVALRAR